MKPPDAEVLALIVRQAPYGQRSARTQLDVALAAASLELPLEIYFLGSSVWQLAKVRKTASAGLAGGLRGWAAVSGLTEARFFADDDGVADLKERDLETVVALEALDPREMAQRWLSCRQVVSL